MELLCNIVYWGACLAGATFSYLTVHFMLMARKSDSLAVRQHAGLMSALCAFASVVISLLVAAPYLFTTTP